MNDNATDHELPELSDEDIQLLHEICRRATSLTDPPFKALFAAYQEVFTEENIDPEHDSVVFRLLLHIGERVRAAVTEGTIVDFVEDLKNILESHGITLLEEDDGSESRGVISSNDSPRKPAVNRSPQDRRRVSWDDARLEETWLSERSALNIDPSLRLPPLPIRQAQDHFFLRRTRSISPSYGHAARVLAPKHQQPSSGEPSSHDDWEPPEFAQPKFFLDPSQTQLEQNADAFLATSSIRTARACLNTLYDKALKQQAQRSRANNVATEHDHRTLLRQSFNALRAACSDRVQVRQAEAQLASLENRQVREYETRLKRKAFTHWHRSAQDQQEAVERAKVILLQIRYFKRWRAITSENTIKSRRILTRKYISIWREKTARHALRHEQAEAHLEEHRLEKCFQALFWEFCSRRVEDWHEGNVRRRALQRWVAAVDVARARRQHAAQHYNAQLCKEVLRSWQERLAERREDFEAADEVRVSRLALSGLRSLAKQARLLPLARELRAKADTRLQGKALKVWNLHLSLSQQAGRVDRQRILQSAWTSWNDALRCRVLSQRIDERVVVECLYRWVLQERLRLFRRNMDRKALGGVLSTWRQKTERQRSRLDAALAIFEERKLRRRAASAMYLLNTAIRKREDDERMAIEFRNANVLPKVLDSWTAKTKDIALFDRWAADARYYVLCTRTLKVWKERTVETQYNRKRAAYAQIRSSVKTRIARTWLSKWRERTAAVVEMDHMATKRSQDRIIEVGIAAFGQLRDSARHMLEINRQAAAQDRQRLLIAAFSTWASEHERLELQEQQAREFRRETDLALLASALKRMQWQQFTAIRREESAEALWARNRDVHMRQMIRLWAQLSLERRNEKTAADEEPDSPSLRPASRAASRTTSRTPFTSPPAKETRTPAYLRTPSRIRKAGRFRPLPTPALMTPFAVDQARFASTTPEYLTRYETSTPRFSPPANDRPGLDISTLSASVTPFANKLRAGGIVATSTPAPRSSMAGRANMRGAEMPGTAKSVRFSRASRFRRTS